MLNVNTISYITQQNCTKEPLHFPSPHERLPLLQTRQHPHGKICTRRYSLKSLREQVSSGWGENGFYLLFISLRLTIVTSDDMGHCGLR